MRVLRGVLDDIATTDGMIPLSEVDRAIALIERGTIELDQAYAIARQKFEAEEAAAASPQAPQASPQKRFWMRSDPLYRLLVRPFEAKFFENPPTFHRKFLGAYFEVARQIIGPDITAYDNECRAIIQSLLEEQGANLNWELVYADGRTVALMRRVVGIMVRSISDDSGLKRWNSGMMKPAPDGAMPDSQQLDGVRSLLLGFVQSYSAAAA